MLQSICNVSEFMASHDPGCITDHILSRSTNNHYAKSHAIHGSNLLCGRIELNFTFLNLIVVTFFFLRTVQVFESTVHAPIQTATTVQDWAHVDMALPGNDRQHLWAEAETHVSTDRGLGASQLWAGAETHVSTFGCFGAGGYGWRRG